MSTTRTTRAIGRGLVAIGAVVAMGFVALMLVPGMLGMDRYVITGGSMSGTFERGTLVLERQVPVDDLRVGDVITYLPPTDSGVTELVTHRIVDISEKTDAAGGRVLRTKGDANASADPWTFTLAAAQQPRVEGWVPTVGWVFIALSLPGIRMLAIGVPAALIALLYLRDLLRGLRLWPRRAPAVAQL
ncbi:signal peptidase I [Microbacterium sp. NPDC057659]|uniref:signal peptidase I n=1 Tax=Microbacterium sp. NPDC057659 TaxID=3346198 RepID=UPI00366D6553